MYGFTGFIEGARIGSNTANTGFNYELDAIAACVIGGVSFVGGIGKIRGVVVGVLMLRLIFIGLSMMKVDPNLQYLSLIHISKTSRKMEKSTTKRKNSRS